MLSGRFPMSKNITVEGDITFNNVQREQSLKTLSQFVAYVNQRDKHYPVLTVKETLQYAHEFCGADLSEHAKKMLSQGTPEENDEATTRRGQESGGPASRLGRSNDAGTQSKEDLAQLSSALRHQEKKFQNAKPASSARAALERCGARRGSGRYTVQRTRAAPRALSPSRPRPPNPCQSNVSLAVMKDAPECVICLDELELGFTLFMAVRPQLPFQLAAGELGKVPDPGGPCQLLGLLGPLRLY
ncbi:hypothetical protein PR001_g30286 [Phytophthora rubi]|uniref:Uncharacterized protein n=1 Tax=Phytophthora rubi TaxID=129364 RepID=A0A6A3GUF2_9STRA|nr:hypothetical protein PR001_g30286 [Phytophthora rubi]